jgi:two-component system chemotaxis response regulator CheY
MPEMTGYDFLRACKEDPKFQHIPFVMVSAESETEAIVEALKSGASDFLSKPISRDNLSRKIEKIITQKIKKAA